MKDDVVSVDVDAFLEARGDTVRFVHDLLGRTAARPGRFGCFGLHEWAMVYRLDSSDVRHAGWPLRLGPDGTDAVVESHQVACSHFDAFRFFTPEAVPRNLLSPPEPTSRHSSSPAASMPGWTSTSGPTSSSPRSRASSSMECFEPCPGDPLPRHAGRPLRPA